MVGIMPLLRRSDANSRSNVRPAIGVPDHRAATSEKEATMTKQANDFRGRIFSREPIVLTSVSKTSSTCPMYHVC